MENTPDAVDILQDCIMTTGDFDKNLFIQLIDQMTPERFNAFAKYVIHLRHYYDLSCGACVCDIKPFIEKHPDMFWKLEPLDFDAPINFRSF